MYKIDLNNNNTKIEEPLGFIRPQSIISEKNLGETDGDVTKQEEQKLLTLKKKRAMDMGIAPGKQLFMTMFMLYMAGGGVHIFSIMIVGMSLLTPIKAITSVKTYFQPLEGDGIDLTQPKLAYVALNFVGLGIALYKCFTMGLLPLSSTDWVNLVEAKQNSEFSGGGISF